MKKIPLTRGLFAKVDDEDYDALAKFKWYSQRKGNKFYAARNSHGGRKRPSPRILYMHRIIMGSPDGLEVDHKNLDTLNNQKSNLRICTHAQNSQNRPVKKNNKIGIKGVFWHINKWQVKIQVNKKEYNVGRFSSLKEAKRAYKKKAMELHGEFART